MDRRHLLALASAVLLAAGRPAAAGIFFGKKSKPTPAERVPELVKELRTDGDEHKRSAAAEELRQYDPQQFPEMVPALIEALLSDAKPAVRAEAAQTLGKLRPVNPTAGAALEQALAKDGSMRVRLQARSSLMQYRWAGYVPKVKEEPAQAKVPPPQSKEPPLAAEPPPTAPRLAPVPSQATGLTSGPRPLPVGAPVQRTSEAAGREASSRPAATPSSLTKPVPADDAQGPDLTPP
jgi:hypothetical protein